ncbi:MAG: GxxExxY protein [Calditrichaceae bacterium]|nr:GxxExxY protein [Calditrichia bacterium]NUQ41137.1 GxxExxY protein [Calditrichaceae bacterium]
MVELLYKEEVYKIVGAAMEVHRELGPGFLEPVYQEALAIEFEMQKIPFREQPQIKLFYKDQQMETYYKPDFFCYDKIIVEIKALKKCTEIEEAQVLNALKASKQRVGVLINLGEPSLFWKRYIF